MQDQVVRLIVAVGLVGVGWVAGTAQSAGGDFEVRIEAVAGPTNVECVRGCKLIGSRDVTNPEAAPSRTWGFECTPALG
jgi:hypothetical protein